MEIVTVKLMNYITESAKRYRAGANSSILRNNHMNNIQEGEVVEQRVIDAVLVDFINHIGTERCVDYGLYTMDLEKKPEGV